MADYLMETLGVDSERSAWIGADRLPLYLQAGRTYSKLTMDGIEYLIMHIQNNAFSLSAFQKQLKRLQDYTSDQIILQFDQLSSYQKKALIQNRIPFYIPNSQIYFPFLGVSLKERDRLPLPEMTKFSAMAQYTLLFMLNNPEKMPVQKKDLADLLEITAMSITRSVKELTAAGLVESKKAGRSEFVSLLFKGEELAQKASDFMIDPVQKRVYVIPIAETDQLPLAGESALAMRSMLAPPRVECRAIERKQFRQLERIQAVDPNWTKGRYIQLEIWKYDPMKLCGDGSVDAISLSLTMQGETDERIEMAVQEMMGNYSW